MSMSNHLELQPSVDISMALDGDDEPSTSFGPANRNTQTGGKKNCSICNEDIDEKMLAQHLLHESHKINFKQFLKENMNRIYSITNNDESILDLNLLFERNSIALTELLKADLDELTAIKFKLELNAEFVKYKIEDCAEVRCMSTKMAVLLKSDDISEKLKDLVGKILVKFEDCKEKYSGSALMSLKEIKVHVNQYQPLGQGSQFYELPSINAQNEDKYSFKRAIISALDKGSAHNIQNIADDFICVNNTLVNFSNMNFPLLLKDVKTFEINNPDISVNVFGYKSNTSKSVDDIVGPYYHTQGLKSKHINLLCSERSHQSALPLKNFKKGPKKAPEPKRGAST